MAVLIPEAPDNCQPSERLVYERLGADLPESWVVLHSLGLPGHETKFWGEADIVVISERGIFALEVKGGPVSCRDGVWHFGSGNRSYTKTESPWVQSKGTMTAIRKSLQDADPLFNKVLFGFGVVMPHTRFTTSSTEIDLGVLLDRRDFAQDLMHYIRKLEAHWSSLYQERRGRAYAGLTAEQIRVARTILRPDLEATYSLGSYLTGIERRLLQLTNEQIRASRRMSANPRTIVRGQAGTGKTVIAMERVRQLREAGHSVLYLCFNQLLARHVRLSLATDERAKGAEVWHVHALFNDIVVRAGMGDRLNAEDRDRPEFYAQIFPDLVSEALCVGEPRNWDAIVIDEAQDLLTIQNLDVLDLMLTGGLNRGRWHLFMDPQQNIYGGDIHDRAVGRLEELFPTFDDLQDNCRNTRQVALHASLISGIDLAVGGAPDGEPAENIFHASREDLVAKLDKAVGTLIAAEVKPRDIAILSTRRRENSAIAGLTQLGGRSIVDADEEGELTKGAVIFSTMHAFKGLERMVVLAIDMDGIGEDHLSMLHYAGLSRACALLKVFVPTTARDRLFERGKAFGRRQRSLAL